MKKYMTIEEQVEFAKNVIKGIAKFQDEIKKMGIKCNTSISVEVPTQVEEKEEERSKVTQLIQSRCIHRRMGIMTEGAHKFFHCQDCGKPFPEKEI